MIDDYSDWWRSEAASEDAPAQNLTEPEGYSQKEHKKWHSERYKGRDIWAKPKFSEQGKFLGWEGEIAWAPPYQACVISDRPYQSPEEALAFCREQVDEDLNFFLF